MYVSNMLLAVNLLSFGVKCTAEHLHLFRNKNSTLVSCILKFIFNYNFEEILMHVSTANDVKIYNLSAGKSIPEWMGSEARRRLERKDIDVRRRIQLIQDFDMPDISRTLNISPDGRYVLATGAYKPWLKCYDLNDLSLKFERGIDSDIIKVVILSDDYSKFVLLEEERYLEMHATFGRYFRMRMPRFGRDMSYSRECSDLYLVGASSEIFRLNLEQGEWLSPLQTHSNAVNCCQFSNHHQLFVCGTVDGHIEAWDHRNKSRVGVLNCLPSILEESNNGNEVTALKFQDALHIGVGMSSGHVLLFDIRSNKPLIVKDHNNGIPIKKLDFVNRDEGNLVLSMDERVLKMWDENSGKPFAAIETETTLTDFTRYPNSGLIFFANEAPRMLQYFVPLLGTAPKWCSYLETITEELEENTQPTVYDDYKFVTKPELVDMGLSHLIGSSLLRAYMHGYFIDIRLYNKAQTLTQPFAYDKYKERKIKDLVLEERENVIIKKKDALPKINKDLAIRLRLEAETDISSVKSSRKKRNEKKKASVASTILTDDRFKKLFESEDFEVDETNEQYQRNLGFLERQKAKEQVILTDNESGDEDETTQQTDFLVDDDDDNIAAHSLNSDFESGSESESEDSEKNMILEKEKRREEFLEKKHQRYMERQIAMEAEREIRLLNKPKKFMLHELGPGESTQKFLDEKIAIDSVQDSVPLRDKKQTLDSGGDLEDTPFGERSITFTLQKKGAAGFAERENKRRAEHKKERKETVRRATASIARTLKKLPGNLDNRKGKRK